MSVPTAKEKCWTLTHENTISSTPSTGSGRDGKRSQLGTVEFDERGQPRWKYRDNEPTRDP